MFCGLRECLRLMIRHIRRIRHSVLESIKTSCFRGELFRNDICGLGHRRRGRPAGRSHGERGCPACSLGLALLRATLSARAGGRAGKMDGWGNDGGQVESSLFNSSCRRGEGGKEGSDGFRPLAPRWTELD